MRVEAPRYSLRRDIDASPISRDRAALRRGVLTHRPGQTMAVPNAMRLVISVGAIATKMEPGNRRFLGGRRMVNLLEFMLPLMPGIGLAKLQCFDPRTRTGWRDYASTFG